MNKFHLNDRFQQTIQIMFYFQYVIQRIKLDYDEFSPYIHIRFGQISNQLPLPDLVSGNNDLGLGKQLTINISANELKTWFNEQAFCIQFQGGVLNGRVLQSICSLQKLQLTQQINNFLIVLKDPQDQRTKAQLVLSLKYRHIHNNQSSMAKTQFIQNKKEIENNLEKLNVTTSINNKKSNSFLYGNNNNLKSAKPTKSNSQITAKKTYKKQSIAAKKGTPTLIKKNQQSYHAQIQQKLQQPYQNYHQNQPYKQISTHDMFNQHYYCPPPMQFTNNPIEPPKPKYYPAPVMKSAPKQQMTANYSFQGVVAKQKKIQKTKVIDAIQKKRIKEMVEEEFKNKQAHILVPVKNSEGQIVFKKIDQIKQSDLGNLISKKSQQPKQTSSISPLLKKAQSYVAPKTNELLPVNISVEYPQDFQSMSHSMSILSKEIGLMSKIKKPEEVVHQQSISQIYSDNFQSYSASRSYIKKSFQDISESIRSSKR